MGDTALSNPLIVDREEILEFALKYDPQDFHADEQAAEQSHFGGLIAPGILTAALWRIMDHEINGDIKFVCGFGWDEVRWAHPVRPGDKLRASSEILSKRDATKPVYGHAIFAYQVINQLEQTVMSFTSHNLIWKKAS